VKVLPEENTGKIEKYFIVDENPLPRNRLPWRLVLCYTGMTGSKRRIGPKTFTMLPWGIS